MKQHHKVGNRNGLPAYRTPSGFKVRRAMAAARLKNFETGKKAKVGI